MSDARHPADPTDFVAFVHATGTGLYRSAYLLTGDHHLAEDLTQATYAKVYSRWGRVCRADNPVGYTRAVLTNTFLSHRRLRRNTEVPSDTADPAGTATPTAPDGDQVAGSEGWAARRDLVVALGHLSPTDRAVLVARYWEDRSVADTAHDLGLSEDVVRTRSRRALQRLRPLVTSPTSERTTT